MNTPHTEDRADTALRELLALADPEARTPSTTPTPLLDRVLADIRSEDPRAAPGAHGVEPATASRPLVSPTPPPGPSFLRRHWQGSLLAAAAVCSIALATPTVLPGLLSASTGADSTASGEVASQSATVGTEAAGAAGGSGYADSTDKSAARDSAAALVDQQAPAADAPSAARAAADEAAEQRLVRSGSVLVGTDDVSGGRDQFVAAILAMGGRVMSETVVTQDGNGAVPNADGTATSDMRTSYPYPYPTGPGIWVSVEVPAESYDEAIDAARSAGEVVQLQQTSYDVGTQIADTDARIKALEASLARLTALMDEANSVSDVIRLEEAISSRQQELDGLKAQQRDLANQTAMSQVSLTLMSPEDARGMVEPQPDQTWWESFVEGLGQFWSWLGQALLIVSPLLVAGGVIWFVRRRMRRNQPDAGRAQAGSAPGGTPPPVGPPPASSPPAASTPSGPTPIDGVQG